ncbi:ATP-binding cassette domain-containing protein [Verminephrobacter sp. Larva24]|nr:ATP-binding cassette domain-containing protein [Verminephrobacter sp. Larva24]
MTWSEMPMTRSMWCSTISSVMGAGKSSLLKSIAGLEPIASGRILIDGRDIGAIPAHKRLQCGVTLAPEGRGIFPDQSVLDNLLLGAYSLQATAAEINALVGHGFELFPRLAQRQAQWAGTLSGGEQQMLALARALAWRHRGENGSSPRPTARPSRRA